MESGSLPGTYVVRNATRVPGSGVTGTGSRATSVAWAMETTLTSMNSSISAIDTSITVSAATSQRSPFSRSVQCVGQTRYSRSAPVRSGASAISRTALTRCFSVESRLLYRTRYPVGSGSVSGPASRL